LDFLNPVVQSLKAILPVASQEVVNSSLIARERNLQRRLSSVLYQSLGIELATHDYLNVHCADQIVQLKLLLTSAQQQHSLATTWLLAIPNPAYQQTMTPIQFRAVLHYRLLIPFLANSSDCPQCGIESKLDRFGYHLLACRGSNNRCFTRHEGVVEALNSVANLAGFSPALHAHVQCLGFKWDALHCYRPADLLIRGDGPQQTCVDVTIPSPLCPSYITNALGVTVTKKAEDKIKKHGEACAASHYGFLPFVVDTCGLIETGSLRFLNRIASSYSAHSGTPYSVCAAYCRRRISFALHRGIGDQLAAMFLLQQQECQYSRISASRIFGITVTFPLGCPRSIGRTDKARPEWN
jgi:hypothetical protein